MIYIEPHGGLGNRMRAIASANELAMINKTKLVVLWKKDAGMNCQFSRLFKKIDNVDVIEVTSTLQLFCYKLMVILRGGVYDKKGTWRERKRNEECLKHGKNIYIRSCSQFLSSVSFSIFVPIDEILTWVEEKIAEHWSNVVGVHVRRTDNVQAIKVSTLDVFQKMMHESINNDPKVRFYISTDDYEVELFLKKAFPERIISNGNKDLRRNSEKGIQDALVDMFCLSKCKTIIGSYNSSFSEVASVWQGKNQLLIAGNN